MSGAVEVEVVRSTAIREANGLRSDRAWVVAVVTDPASVNRLDIRVSSDEAATLDEHSIRSAMSLRRDVGMRADEPWVRSLAVDPRAVLRMGVRMSPDEAATFDERIRNQLEVGPAVVAYGERFPDSWAGAYIDKATGDVVASFAGDVETHRAAILALVGPSDRVTVRQVRHSTAELDRLGAPIWTEAGQGWLRALGVRVLGGGSRVIENDVALEVAVGQPDPVIGQRIVDHFNDTGWLTLQVTVTPDPPTLFGGLRVTVVDSAGKPLGDALCWIHPDIDGYAGDDVIHFTDDPRGCVWDRLGATGYRVDVHERLGLDDDPIGTGSVIVSPDDDAAITITVPSP